jgi:hypothetical protein
LWKNRDFSGNWKQEITFSSEKNDNQGALKVVDNTLSPFQSLASGGVNESGFAIVNSTCYQESPIHEYVSNANLDLLSSALDQCSDLEDFDYMVKTWHENLQNRFMILSGNFAVIDATGQAALYELSTGTGYYSYGAEVMVNRIDAVTGFVTDESGNLIGNNGNIGVITSFPENISCEILNESRELIHKGFSLSDDGLVIVDSNGNTVDDGTNFRGYINRANSNYWVNLKSDIKREERAKTLLDSFAQTGRLSYRNVLQYLARDINPSENDPDTAVNTVDSISRYCTNFAMVVDGIRTGENASSATMWVNLGEPSCGIATPYFPGAGRVPYYAWADAVYYYFGPLDTGPSSLLNKMINKTELRVYDNNISEGGIPCPPDQLNAYFLQSVLNIDIKGGYETIWNEFEGLLSGWHTEYVYFLKKFDTMDKTINYRELRKIQKQSLSLENTIIDNTEKFLDPFRNGETGQSSTKLYDFSEYCAGFAYKNFNKTYPGRFVYKIND